jgi:hypothetical protein
MAVTAYMVVQLHGQTRPAGDFSNAVAAEVRDAQGQVILSGQFAPAAAEEDDDLERKAVLSATAIDADAAGEAEIEVDNPGQAAQGDAAQEIEFSVTNLTAGTRVTFFIDGQAIGQATVDPRGRAEFEIEVER